MKRYAVAVKDIHGRVMYDSIGIGMSDDPQDAHLYTRTDLAEKKTNQYKRIHNGIPVWKL